MRHLVYIVVYSCFAAKSIATGSLQAEAPAASMQSVQRSLQNMSYSINNQDQELATLKQKIQNQESVLDSMHAEVSALIKAAKESQKSTSAQVDTRLKSMEKNLEKLVADLKQFKKHANESSTSFTEIQKKLAEQQEISSLQGQQIKDLENALRHIATALQVKGSQNIASDTSSSGEYRVKAGDTLEKIAKSHGTTIDAIRRENNLSKDIIYPGQKLHIP